MDDNGWQIQWSTAYVPEWDAAPAAYADHGVVGWNRSRRLAHIADPARGFKAYLGVHHFDPDAYGQAGAPSVKFFLSLFDHGRTAAFRTFATIPEALAAARAFHVALREHSAS